jgi:prefoldin subunit 5
MVDFLEDLTYILKYISEKKYKDAIDRIEKSKNELNRFDVSEKRRQINEINKTIFILGEKIESLEREYRSISENTKSAFLAKTVIQDFIKKLKIEKNKLIISKKFR